MSLLESAWAEARQLNKLKNGSTQTDGASAPAPPLDILYVQSTDKNLMVPVGGAIIAGFSKGLIKEVAESYPGNPSLIQFQLLGRASGTPSLDVFATLLYIGRRGWEHLCDEREVCYRKLAAGLNDLARKHGLRLMSTPENPISLALSLEGLYTVDGDDLGVHPNQLTQLGARLFTQGCSGVR